MTAPPAEAGARRGRPPRPRDSATLILVDASRAEPRILLGRRNPKARFAPDAFVFPGGVVDRADAAVALAGAFPSHVERRLLIGDRRTGPERARRFAAAAIRELAEETGLLVGRRADTVALPRHPSWAPFLDRGIAPALDGLSLVARAVTPPFHPRRYDNRFLAADASLVAEEVPGVVGPDTELVELVWATFAEAEHIALHPMTRSILVELRARLLDGGLAADLPVPFFRFRRDRWLRRLIA